MVPEQFIDDVQTAISTSLKGIPIGDPRVEGVRMGALAGKSQVQEVKQK